MAGEAAVLDEAAAADECQRQREREGAAAAAAADRRAVAVAAAEAVAACSRVDAAAAYRAIPPVNRACMVAAGWLAGSEREKETKEGKNKEKLWHGGACGRLLSACSATAAAPCRCVAVTD